jgi:hypothetical protein
MAIEFESSEDLELGRWNISEAYTWFPRTLAANQVTREKIGKCSSRDGHNNANKLGHNSTNYIIHPSSHEGSRAVGLAMALLSIISVMIFKMDHFGPTQHVDHGRDRGDIIILLASALPRSTDLWPCTWTKVEPFPAGSCSILNTFHMYKYFLLVSPSFSAVVVFKKLRGLC